MLKFKFITSVLLVMVIAGGFVGTWHNIHKATAASPAAAIVGTLPECASKEATSMMKDAVENGAYKDVKVQLLDWDKLAEISYDENEGTRECIGDFTLNTGNETLHYILKRAKSDPSKILIQAEEVTGYTKDGLRVQAAEHAKTPAQQAQDEAQIQRAEQQQDEAYRAKQNRAMDEINCLTRAEQTDGRSDGPASDVCKAKAGEGSHGNACDYETGSSLQNTCKAAQKKFQ